MENEKVKGINIRDIVNQLINDFGSSMDPQSFVDSINNEIAGKSFTPLEFAEMAKKYNDNPCFVASCIKRQYKEYNALQVGNLLLQPTIYPTLSIASMTAALTQAGFSQGEAEKAVEELYGETSVGYVLMLDTSSSMDEALGQVKIDAKAFVGCSKYKDQLGINQFNDTASWVYPSNSNIVTVDEDLKILKDAANAIENRINCTHGMTAMGEAINLGNEMLKNAVTDTKAFIILSDGYSNVGRPPESVLGNEPPIFVAGLGRILRKEFFTKLLAKNQNSKFYWKPTAIDMMEVFNDIRAEPKDVALTTNGTAQYSGSNFQVIESLISEESEEAQFNVVWSDQRCQYTPNDPTGFNINVILYDPTGKKTNYKPQITGAGYCVFNVYGVQPGTWKTLVQYSLPETIHGTTGGFEFNTLLTLNVEGPAVHQKGAPLTFTAKVFENGLPVENAIVHAQVMAPTISLENALIKYSNELQNIVPDESLIECGEDENIARLHSLRMEKMKTEDILETARSLQILQQNDDGHFEGLINPMEAGAYNIKVTAEGVNSLTKMPFKRVKEYSVLVC